MSGGGARAKGMAAELPEWSRKAEAEAGDKVALLIFRRSREPWRVCLRLDDFLAVLEQEA